MNDEGIHSDAQHTTDVLWLFVKTIALVVGASTILGLAAYGCIRLARAVVL